MVLTASATRLSMASKEAREPWLDKLFGVGSTICFEPEVSGSVDSAAAQ